MAKGAYIGVEPPEKVTLPTNYTQVEYIESKGTQYIDTGYIPNQDTRIVAKIRCTSGSTSGNYVFGANDGTYRYSFGKSVNYYIAGYNNQNTAFSTNASTSSAFVLDMNKNKAVIGEYDATTGYSAFSVSKTLTLFAMNDVSGILFGECAIYSFKIYDNGTLVRDFIPCIGSDGFGGMFDLVQSKFYYSLGPGNFVSVGNEVKSVARKVNRMYVGIEADYPVYETQTVNTNITADNIEDFFTVTNGAYYFKGNGSTFTTTNGGVASSTATTTLTARKDMEISFEYSYGSETNYDLFTLVFGSQTIHNEVSGTRTTKSLSGKLSKGITISFKYTKDNSRDENGDSCSFGNMTVTTEEQVQIESVRKSLARRIKKAYIGIGGKARPFLSSGELAYYGGIDALADTSTCLAATTVGNYALFGGGKNASTYFTTITSYDKTLTKTRPTGLGTGRFFLAATTVGNYALFGGGEGSSYYANVDAYNDLKTKSTPTSLTTTRSMLAAATVGNYALFGGGVNGTTRRTTVDTYNTSLTLKTATALSVARYNLAAGSVGDYVLFGGGYTSSHSSSVDAYDKSLVKTSVSGLSKARANLKAATVGEYVLFVGGGDDTTNYGFNTVDAYDSSLTRTTITSTSVEHSKHAAGSLGEYALFAGGKNASNVTHGVVDVYDKSLTLSTVKSLSTVRESFAATSIGDFALFGGGYNSNTGNQSSVEAYTCEIPTITINLVILKTEGDTLYTSVTQTVSIKAKAGMRYFDLAYSDNNTVEIPGSNGNTLTVALHSGNVAWKCTTATGNTATFYVATNDVGSGIWLIDGMTITMLTSAMDNFDLNKWTIV